MDLDIRSIMRLLIPGLIFIVVTLSHYLFDPEIFSKLANLSIIDDGLLVLTIALAIGVIIQYFYYGFVHVGLSERDVIQKEDTIALKEVCKEKSISENDLKNINDRQIDFAIDYCLNAEAKNNEHKDRIYFYFHQIHSYGASICAVIFGSFLGISGIITGYFKINSAFLFYPWGIIIFSFYIARKAYREHMKACREIYIKNNATRIINVIGGEGATPR